MKKIALLAAALLIVLGACGQQKKQEKQKMKKLVAYFSATGTTEAIAKKLAEVTGADLYQIKPEVPYTAADLDWHDRQSRSTLEMRDKNSRPAFVKDLEKPEQYGTVYLGFPIWWYTAPTIINTFLETYDFSGKTVILFATSGSSSLDNANALFRQNYPDIKWIDGKTLNGASKEDIAEWVKSLK